MILGIDPGLENTGWAVIKDGRLVGVGVILTSKKDSSQARLKKIYEEIQKIIKKEKVNVVSMESLFFAKNAKSALEVAEAIGVIKIAAEDLKVAVFEYTPLQIKMALVGYGRAEKEQVEVMVRQSLGIEENIKPSHASDAVAAALTHEYTSSFVRDNKMLS
ncbi:crossover junction endodeoxyribonuclease RuvC [Candidatus Shapirobacteria bacterium]|nr:crossover junction endodeoxyribonuclease RuvC [Candidatus Shapirobacteria bacterium]